MGKKRLLTSIIVGAIAGGLFALTNKDSRAYAKTALGSVQEEVSKLLEDPAVTLQQTQVMIDKFSKDLSAGTTSTKNALEQIEQTITKFIK